MTREELKAHCERQIAKCEALYAEDDKMLNSNKLYHEHKLILELLEQFDVLDKIRAEIADTLDVGSLVFIELHEYKIGVISTDDVIEKFNQVTREEVLKIIDKYRVESEG